MAYATVLIKSLNQYKTYWVPHFDSYINLSLTFQKTFINFSNNKILTIINCNFEKREKTIKTALYLNEKN